MKNVVKIVAIAGLIGLGACSNTPAENAAENVESAYDNAADALDAAADNTTNEVASDALENQADVTRDVGEAKADAVEANAAVQDAANGSM